MLVMLGKELTGTAPTPILNHDLAAAEGRTPATTCCSASSMGTRCSTLCPPACSWGPQMTAPLRAVTSDSWMLPLQIVALANLAPSPEAADELDSYMYQTVGHQLVAAYAQCMALPLFRCHTSGHSHHQVLPWPSLELPLVPHASSRASAHVWLMCLLYTSLVSSFLSWASMWQRALACALDGLKLPMCNSYIHLLCMHVCIKCLDLIVTSAGQGLHRDRGG